MRFLKWISVLTILAVLFAMLPATVAEDEIVIRPVEVDGQAPEIEMDDAAVIEVIDDPALAPEDIGIELDGLENDLLISESEESVEASVASNASRDFEIDEEGTLTRYRGVDKNVVIPDGVKAIGDEAFVNDTLMESVSIPNSVTYIGYEAFSGCTALKVTALKTGKAKITVKTDNGKSASATITVKPAPTKIVLNKTRATLGVREKLTLKAAVSPSKAYTTLTWKSSTKAVATVSKQGVVIPKKPGTAVITVRTKNGKTAKCTVTVKAAPKKVTLNKSGTVTLKQGKKLKLKATLPKDTASALTWKSSKPKVASVDQKGNVRALKKGTAVITVKTFNGRTAKVTIKVK